MESVTLTLSDKTSSLTVYYFPPIELSPNKNYVLGLTDFLTFHSIPNVDESNNKFHVGSRIITIPTSSYGIEDLEKYLKNQLSEKISFSLKPNNNTLTSVIMCSEEIDFTPKNSISQLLGLTGRKLERDTEHNSDLSVKILRVNSLS